MTVTQVDIKTQAATDTQQVAVTQADIDQARNHNILYAEDRTVLTLRLAVQDRSWRWLRRKKPVWVVVRRDTKPLPVPYPPYASYRRWLERAHWVGVLAPRGLSVNALYRRAMVVTWTPEGRLTNTPRAGGAGVTICQQMGLCLRWVRRRWNRANS